MPRTLPDQLAAAYALRGNLSVDDFLIWAGIGRTKFYQEVKEGKIRIRKIGSKSVVTMPDALAWLNALPEAA